MSGWSCLSSGCCTVEEKAVKRIVMNNPSSSRLDQSKINIKKTSTSSSSSSSSYPPPARISMSDWSSSSSTSTTTLSEDLSASLVGSNLHAFSRQELKLITNSFSSSNFLGEGGFGPVYKGFLDDRLRPGLPAQPVAVKLLDSDGLQGHKEWLTEVIFLGQLRHCHLVKLIGYCCEDQHRLLVYEYMPRGSLENQLHSRYSVPLSWSTRMKIALEAAKGLSFLHEADKPVIYRDLKSSNILLDSDYTAKLSDFGLAKDGPEGDETHVSTRVMGTHGYAAPEYIMTGRLTAMSDVYSFGVVLLELMTGRKPADKHRPHREQNLVEWARPALNDVRRLRRILDPRLEGQYPDCGARTVASMAYRCLSQRPKHRPTMRTVVETLEPLLHFKDIFAVPIVFTFHDGELKKEEPKEEAAAKSNGHSGHRNHHHRRHRDQVRPSTSNHKDAVSGELLQKQRT